MAKYITEILQELNDNPELAKTTYKDNSYLKILFFHAFEADGKFNLPKGEPPFNRNQKPIGMTETTVLWEINKLKIFIRKDLPALKIESIFISLLESIHPDEAEILLAVKDQKLHRLYSKINRKFALNNGFIEAQLDVPAQEPI